MSIPRDPPAPAAPQKSRISRLARRSGCLAPLLVPFLLLAVIVMAPVWINDHRLARMVDRIQANPLPSGTVFGYFDPQVEVSGDSGDCWYTIRFQLSTERPVQEVLNHYRQAKIEDPDGELGDYEVEAWISFDEPGTPVDGSSATHSVIIDLDGMYDGTGMDMRCY
ncbi:hypothetical protein E1295_03905 [Nonomuraea mesophila]|uniref:Uncharacterized protein n=1 Tax=Nonomuraea mesophila TaxID=2530382 RepID=A0A4R5FX35_9ACTN|nr:hypothetical protein [Nonomuraea mesophila]TDE59055.1 hypothetical protein E1295_03905 [Nonomuraea mesophila]